MHVFAPSSARGLLRELKRFHTSFSGHKCIKNVYRPGSARTRWGSLSAPPDPLAVGVAASRPGRVFCGEDKKISFPPPTSTFLDPRLAGLKGRARKGYTVANACAKWTGKGGRRKKMRVGGEVSGLKRLGDRGNEVRRERMGL